MSTEVALPTGITQDMINAAVQKYGTGKVATVQLPKDDQGSEYLNTVIHQPGRESMGQYLNLIDKNLARANEILIKACIDDKDVVQQILADTGLYLAAVDACSQLIPVRKSIIKNF